MKHFNELNKDIAKYYHIRHILIGIELLIMILMYVQFIFEILNQDNFILTQLFIEPFTLALILSSIDNRFKKKYKEAIIYKHEEDD